MLGATHTHTKRTYCGRRLRDGATLIPALLLVLVIRSYQNIFEKRSYQDKQTADAPTAGAGFKRFVLLKEYSTVLYHPLFSTLKNKAM